MGWASRAMACALLVVLLCSVTAYSTSDVDVAEDVAAGQPAQLRAAATTGTSAPSSVPTYDALADFNMLLVQQQEFHNEGNGGSDVDSGISPDQPQTWVGWGITATMTQPASFRRLHDAPVSSAPPVQTAVPPYVSFDAGTASIINQNAGFPQGTQPATTTPGHQDNVVDPDASIVPINKTEDLTDVPGPTKPSQIKPEPFDTAHNLTVNATTKSEPHYAPREPIIRAAVPTASYGCSGGKKCCFTATSTCPLCPSTRSLPSTLWGCSGELKVANGRLSDWSYAGYRGGEHPLPTVPWLANIKTDFGAKGDGKTDDTAAFLKAITAVQDGTLYIPTGTYVITQQLTIVDTDLVMHGDGVNKTVLYFPKSLTQVYGNTWAGGISQYSYYNAWIYFLGKDFIDSTNQLATITANADRGATTLSVSNTSQFVVGSWVRIVQDDVDGGLAKEQTRGLTGGDPALAKTVAVMRFPNRVISIGKGSVTFERPMPYSVKPAWKARVNAIAPKTQEQGIENLTIRFPLTTYPGRYKEQGYNALYFWEGNNAWVKNVNIENADLGIQMAYCTFCTISGVNLLAGNRGVNGGHMGIVVTRGADNLVDNFSIQTKFWHDTYVTLGALFTVLSDGSGLDMTLEVSGQPFGTLFTNLNLGAGTRPFGYVVPPASSGAYTTFWGIYSAKAFALPLTQTYGPLANFINVNSANNNINTQLQWFIEQPRPIYPTNLAAQQNSQRLVAKPPPKILAPAPAYIGPGYGCDETTRAKCCFTATSTCPKCGTVYRTPSILWGCGGELYDPRGRLVDWSYAGYGYGEKEIPTVAQGANVKDFGAKGDGVTDDTAAFKSAISQCPWNTALVIPAGTYVITDRLDFAKSLVIRGAGVDQTILYFPKSMTDLSGNTWPSGVSQWTNGPFFITYRGDSKVYPATKLASVLANAAKGDTVLKISSPVTPIQVGQWVRIVQSDPPNASLTKMLLGNIMQPGSQQGNTLQMIKFFTRVTAVGSGTITLERPLPYAVGTQWTPEVHKWVIWVEQCGLEAMTIKFPLKPYPGHGLEAGYNAVAMFGPFNSWIRNVKFLNADLGIAVGSTFMTIINCTFTTTGSRGNNTQGHYGMTVWTGSDILVSNLAIPVVHNHDISVNGYAVGIVYKNIMGLDMNLDHHRLSPYGILYTNLNLGEGTRSWLSGGELNNGPWSGSHGTWWNLASKYGIRLPEPDYGPFLNFVAIRTSDTSSLSPYNWYTEYPSRLHPTDLHLAMVNWRKKRMGITG